MLRPGAGRPIDKFYSPDERMVNLLPEFGVARNQAPGESIAVRRERAEREALGERAIVTKLAAKYVEAPKRYGIGRALDFARANDGVLRTLIRKTDRDAMTTSRWFNDLRKEIDRQIVAAGTLDAKTRAEIIDKRDQSMAKSMDQLIPFIESVRKNSPQDILATGIELDVVRGIDMLRANPIWNPSSGQLEVAIDLYQAKAGKIDEAGLVNLAESYLEKAQQAQEELDIDPDWFTLRGREAAEFKAMDIDQLLAILAGEQTLATPEAGSSPLGDFKRQSDITNQLNEMARQLGADQVAEPKVVLKDLDFRLLVRMDDGTNLDISLEQALGRLAA